MSGIGLDGIPSGLSFWLVVSMLIIVFGIVLAGVSEQTTPDQVPATDWVYPHNANFAYMEPAPRGTMFNYEHAYDAPALQPLLDPWYDITEHTRWQYCDGNRAYAPDTLTNTTTINPYLAVLFPSGGKIFADPLDILPGTANRTNVNIYTVQRETCTDAQRASTDDELLRFCDNIDNQGYGIRNYMIYNVYGSGTGDNMGYDILLERWSIPTDGDYVRTYRAIDYGLITNVTTSSGIATGVTYNAERLAWNNAYCDSGLPPGAPVDGPWQGTHNTMDTGIRGSAGLLPVIALIIGVVIILGALGWRP